jgi:hypothetical protein
MSAVEDWLAGDTAPEEIFNELVDVLGQALVFAERRAGHTGLTIGYAGGTFDGNTVADGTVAGLTDDATNYVVVNRSTRAVTSSTATTNWNNSSTYGRMARAVFASGVLTWHDERLSPSGILQEQFSGVGGGASIGFHFQSDTGSTADSDPGAGLFKWNNATQGSATVIYIDDQTNDAVSQTTYFGKLEPGGYMFMIQADDATKWAHWRITSITDASGYTKFGVSLMSKGTDFDDDEDCIFWITSGVCETWAFAGSDYNATALSAATDVGGFIAPYAATVFQVSAGLHTPQTSGSTLTVDINEGASPTSILSTKITFDNGEYSSLDATAQPVISDSSIAAGAKITADIDAVGDGTAKGLTVYMRVFKT